MFTFPLIFLILLSFLLLCGAFLIWKSDLPDNDKITSIISLLGLFCVVAIINEYKRGGMVPQRLSLYDFETNFFTLKDMKTPEHYKLPLLQGYHEHIISNFGDIKIFGLDSFQAIILFEGEPKTGKSFAFKAFTKDLHHKGIPALYFDLQAEKLDINTIFRLQSREILEDTIDKFNRNGKVPFIIIDSAEKAFVSENKVTPFYCQICDVLKDVYDKKKVNIIMITDQIDSKEKLLLSK